MELTLKRLLEQATFNTARKGYDQAEVDEFLDRAVGMATKVEARLTRALEEAKAAPTTPTAPRAATQAPVSAPAGPSEADIEAEVARRVEAKLAETPPAPSRPGPDDPIGPSEEETAEEIRRTIVLAQRTADAAIREAREEAASIVAEAQGDAARARNVARQELAEEIAALQVTRDALRKDTDTLTSHVDGQRFELRRVVSELQAIVDDPERLKVAPTPALEDPEVPADLSEDDAKTDQDDAAEAASGFEPSDGGPATMLVSAVTAQPETDEPEAPEAEAAIPESPGSGTGSMSGAARPSNPTASKASPAPSVSTGASEGDDEFLAELRRAMTDKDPLGPRDDEPRAATESTGSFLDDEGAGRGWRFGKRGR